MVEWVGAAALVVDRFRQADRQVLVADRDDPVRGAIDDREGRAPVALAADQPVAQAVDDLGLGRAALGQLRDDGLAALVRGQVVEGAAVDQTLVRGVGDVRIGHRVVGVGAGRRDDTPDGQAELLGEGEVPLVVGGHGHDRAGAVAGQHVVGDEDRDALAVDRIDGLGADRQAGLLAVGREAVDLGPAAGLLDVRVDLAPSIGRGQDGHQRMLRGQHHERRSEQGVRPRREDPQGLVARSGGPTGTVVKSISAPSERPIQFVCWMRIGSGQSMPSNDSSSSA